MDFTYKGYRQMLANLHNSKYEIATYFDWKEKQQCAILRHDIDYDISKAVDFAAFEHLGGG